MVKLILGLSLLLINLTSFGLTPKDKCPVLPPFIQLDIPVNILFVVQDDGRMRWLAYKEEYNSSNIYKGYFDETKNYRYDWNEKAFVETTEGTAEECPNRPQSNPDYPLRYTQIISGGSSIYTLDYSVLPYSLRIFKEGDNKVMYVDDGNGNIKKYTKNGSNWTKKTVGTIDYKKGEISFNSGLESGNYEVNYTYILKGTYSGSCLNYHYMTRIDIFRRIFTGGSPRSCPTASSYISGINDPKSNTSNANPSHCDFRENTTDVSGDYYYLKPQLFEDWDDRWAKNICPEEPCIAFYTYNAPAVKVSKEFYDKNIIQDIFFKKSDKYRLGLVVYDTANPVIHSNKVYLGDYRTSEWDANESKPYRNLVTSINANRDLFNSDYDECKTANIWDAGNSMAPALWDVYNYFAQNPSQFCGFKKNSSNEYWRDPFYIKVNGKWQFVPCIRNYVVVIGEGMWNIGINDSGNLDYSCNIDKGNLSSDPVVPVDKMKNEGFERNGELYKIDKIFSIALFPYSDYGKNAMKNIALYGSSNPDFYPDDTCDLSEYNSHLSNCKGSLCTPVDEELSNYFTASDYDSLESALYNAIESILSETVSGTSVSVLSEKDAKGALVVQAVFYPKRSFENYKVSWIGQLFSYWFLNTKDAQNIREDSDDNYKLTINDDKILEFKIDDSGKLSIDVYNSDSTGNKSSLYTTYSSLDEINYLWEAGKELKDTSPDDRTIYTVGSSGLVSFDTSNLDKFKDYLGKDPNQFPNCLKNEDGSINYESLVNYVRGEDVPGCRNRTVDSDGNTWKLGDIIHSSPKIVYYRDENGELTNGVVFVASNDGMLHAFKTGKVEKLNGNDELAQLSGTGIGEELWAFIPKHVLPYLRYLADPDYCHIYMHDLSPYIVNADYNNDGNDEIVLIGGLRLGGGCAYTCSGDINNCSSPINPPSDTCSESDCVGLSEYYALDITDVNNPVLLWEFTHRDLGFTYSGPGVIKTKDNKYHVIFGSGPVNYTAQFANNENITLKFFVLDLKTGSLERTIDTDIEKAFAGRIFSNGFDFDEDGYADYLAVGYTRQDGSPTSFKGGVIILGGQKDGDKLRPFTSDPRYWNFKKFTAFGADVGPVTAKVEFMKCFNRWYIYFGTGRWFAKNDSWEVNKNTIFGVPIEIKTDNSGQYYIDVYTGTQDVTNEINVSNICTEASHGVIRGWYINLEDQEKVITDPTVTNNNLIIFASMKPNQNVCDFGGNSRLWTLNCATGGAPAGCPDSTIYTISNVGGSVLLQLSGGDIQQIKLTKDMSRTTGWFKGVAPENAPPTVSFEKEGKGYTGEILLWIEK